MSDPCHVFTFGSLFSEAKTIGPIQPSYLLGTAGRGLTPPLSWQETEQESKPDFHNVNRQANTAMLDFGYDLHIEVACKCR